MPINTALLGRSVIWVVVADGGTAQAYEYHREERRIPAGGTTKHTYLNEEFEAGLWPVKGMNWHAEPMETYQVGHTKRGSMMGRDSAVRHTVVPHSDIGDEIKQHLVENVAEGLAEASRNGAFDYLIIAAPPRIMGEMKAILDKEVADKIIATILKDLTHYEGRALAEHLRDILPLVPKRSGV